MQAININGIRIHAYHGCLEEEARIGGSYIVNVHLKGDFSAATKSDELADTADYVQVYRIVKQQMAIRSKLIEHVAERIATHLKNELTSVKQLSVEVVKLNPPMNGEVDQVSFVIEK
jgi:dihydroneopterin aldolase